MLFLFSRFWGKLSYMSVKIISKIVKIISLIVFTKPLIIAPKCFSVKFFLKSVLIL